MGGAQGGPGRPRDTASDLLAGYADEVMEAIMCGDMVKAVELVRGATGATEKHAVEVVLTLAEGWNDAKERGLVS